MEEKEPSSPAGPPAALFKAVLASEAEAAIIASAADRDLREARLPQFSHSRRPQGFTPAALHGFCSSVPLPVLEAALENVNSEIKSLLAAPASADTERDNQSLRISRQILTALVLQRTEEAHAAEEGAAEAEAAAAAAQGAEHVDESKEERELRAQAILRGEMTPFERQMSGTVERPRMSIMELKRAMGGKIIMPPPRRAERAGGFSSASSLRHSLQRRDSTEHAAAKRRKAAAAKDLHRDGSRLERKRVKKSNRKKKAPSRHQKRGESAVLPASSSSTVAEALKLASDVGGRACNTCTLVNSSENTRCDACGARLPRAAAPRALTGTLVERESSDDNLDSFSSATEPSTSSSDESESTLDSDEPAVKGGQSRPSRTKQKVVGESDLLLDDFMDYDYELRTEIASEDDPYAFMDLSDSTGDEQEGFVMEDGLPLTASLGASLFQHQRTAVRWLWQLRQAGSGGLIGDEMGLGKTAQAAAFLSGLHLVRKLKSVLIVTPATVLPQWLTELRRWAPALRVVVLHGCSTYFAAAGVPRRRRFVQQALNLSGPLVVLVSYEGLRQFAEELLTKTWTTAILDEAQRIRNPDANVTLLSKRLKTPHRIALTGTPIQNSLRELWSLFDFIHPGRLGTLPAFEAEFVIPIRAGNYAGAGASAVRLAFRSAVALRGLIEPYLLRRLKKDIEQVLKLPPKTEQVLFCKLTKEQRAIYAGYLASPEVVRAISFGGRDGNRGICFRAISVLRKLCNHPAMVTSGLDADDEAGYGSGSDDEAEILAAERPLLESGAAERSGKMLVLKQLLPKWFKGGHKALIFCQTRGMLSIIEAWVRERGWRYSRLDGNTPVGTRQPMIDAFNSDPATFLMLATTRTGGVGVNLTGANRVVLFDPDWNPCTDAQARERAWRLGQTSPVTVYRLICAGTIEEKIYQRQVFKTSQAGAVLSRDPRHARQKGKQFSRSEMHDLFSLGDDDCPDDIDALGEELDLGEVDESLQECRDTAAEEPPGSEDGEKNVLKALFNSSQLSGVFSHAQTTEDVAATTAAEAAAQAEVDEAVRQLCRSAGDGRLGFEPTWTGRSGAAPRFGATRAPARGSAGMGSASLLDRIRSRSSLNAPPAVIGAAEGSHPLSNAADRALILRLEAFFANGRAHATKDVLSSFSDVPDSQAVTFRRHLKAVAKCQNGLWKARVAIS